LAKQEGTEIFHALIKLSDILLENFKASSADKLGLSPELLLKINPRLIICSISGFGRTGPWSDLPGYDFAIQALSGLMGITGPVEGPPFKVGVAVADVLTGLQAAVAVLACLNARRESGHGYVIDLALLDCAVAAQVNVVQAFLTNGQVPPRQGNAHLQIVPYQAFQTADEWLVLAVGNDGQWQRFCQAAQRPDLGADSRFVKNVDRVAQREILVPLVVAVLRRQTCAEWQSLLVAAEVPHAPVWNYEQLFASPQAAARGLRVTVRDPQGRPVDFVSSPYRITGATLPPASMPPTLGQNTEEVLRELLGYDSQMIAKLRTKGIV
jgi:crotonobetainyl-CoA:carnitine CoA-transferase CaiB-like acyl-CoA transferase